jgi:hypothetical protein
MANEIHADHVSGNILYAAIRNRLGQVWRPAENMFEDWGTGGRAADDYDIPLADRGGHRYIGAFDASVPAGSYFIQIFLQTGVVPADTDTLVSSRNFIWTGSGELTSLKILANKAVQDKVTGEITFYDDDDLTVLFTQVAEDTTSTCARVPTSQL